MTKPNIGTVRKVLYFEQFDSVVRHVLSIGEDQELEPHEQVCLYIARQLFGCLPPPIGEADIHQALKEILPTLACALDEIDVEDVELETAVVGVADGRYITWTSQDTFLDVATGEKLEFLPRPPMTTISIDVYSVYFRMQEIYKAELEQEHANTT
jgi:hypothetical protein|tara:strand:+ start:6148 stop:6612 length:465 start_codon:yes stop_codon:yes gene_type:complete